MTSSELEATRSSTVSRRREARKCAEARGGMDGVKAPKPCGNTGTDQSFSKRISHHHHQKLRTHRGRAKVSQVGREKGASSGHYYCTWTGERSAGASHVKEAPRSFVQPLRL